MRSRTCAEHCIHLSFTSIFASLVCGCQSEHALSQWPSQANSSIETKIVGGCYKARQSLLGVDAVEVIFLAKKSSLFRLRNQPFLSWQDGGTEVTWSVVFHWVATQVPGLHVDATTITSVVNNVVWMRAFRCALKTLPVKSAKIGCQRRGKLRRKPLSRNANARRLLQRRRLRRPKREMLWMILLKYTHKMPFNFRPPSIKMTRRPRSLRWRERRQPQDLGLRLRRQILPAGLPGLVNRRRPGPPACPWWDGPGPMVFKGPRGRNATGHGVGSAVDDLTGPTDAMTHQGPIIHPDLTVDIERVGSGPGPRHWEGPAPGGRLTIQMLRGRAVSQRGRRMSGLQGLPLILITIITRHRLIIAPCLHHLLPHRQREEPSLWFHRRPDQKTLTNRQVWRVQQRWTTQQQWRVRRMLWMAQQVTGQQGGPYRQQMMSQSSWTTQPMSPTQHSIRSQQGTAQHMMMMTRQVWPTQHTIRTRQWTAQQGVTKHLPMVLLQGTLQRQDRIHPCYRMSAVCSFLHCPEQSTRLP